MKVSTHSQYLASCCEFVSCALPRNLERQLHLTDRFVSEFRSMIPTEYVSRVVYNSVDRVLESAERTIKKKLTRPNLNPLINTKVNN